MGLKASYYKHVLQFNEAGGTSRGVLHTKDSYVISIQDEEGNVGVGELSLIPKLSIDDLPNIEAQVQKVVQEINHYKDHWEVLIPQYPALAFAIEMALIQLKNKGAYYFNNAFTQGKEGIAINGLIWMGDFETMQKRISEKLAQGFNTIKLKIGAIDWEKEKALITAMRAQYSAQELCIRVDANGAFTFDEAMEKLQVLKDLEVHSIEQPLIKGDERYQELCALNPLDIALDEELIGISNWESKKELLERIQPQYIILKPSLLGGFKSTQEWIELATQMNIQWWITSALEGNIGLQAIAEFTAEFDNDIPQGLGTGGVFSNNFPSSLHIAQGHLYQKS